MVDIFGTITDGWNAAAGAVTDGWNAAAGAVTDGWNAAAGAVTDGWNAAAGAVNSGVKTVTDFGGSVYNAGAEIVKGAGDVFGGISNTLMGGFNVLKKYWYVPIIVGGVIVGYKLLNNPAASTNKLIAALAAAKK